MTQPEFVDRELTKSKFVSTMYTLIVDRSQKRKVKNTGKVNMSNTGTRFQLLSNLELRLQEK